ncbi:NAD(P)-binding domain-containing protein [Methanobrevibacter sp. OttesenSCG-928-I08]|nr:NAD(P)-binding domain-containing protein [Methanobrevibacter sp. OttesenSCG-928-I08]
MRIGIIGYGNIGNLITSNIISFKLFNLENIHISNRNLSKLDDLKKQFPKINITDSNIEISSICDIIIISTEPSEFFDVLNEIKHSLKKNVHIIYTCAGIDFKEISPIYEGNLTCLIPSIASFPNNNVKNGVSLFVHSKNTSFENKEFIEGIFSHFSYIKTLDNFNDLEIATILTSCSPAFFSLIVKIISKKASEVSNFSYYESMDFILKTINSSALLIQDNLLNNDEIIKKVATEKGITQEGLDYIENNFNNFNDDLFNILIKKFNKVEK